MTPKVWFDHISAMLRWASGKAGADLLSPSPSLVVDVREHTYSRRDPPPLQPDLLKTTLGSQVSSN